MKEEDLLMAILLKKRIHPNNLNQEKTISMITQITNSDLNLNPKCTPNHSKGN